jgi:ribosomal protein S18 acetylase RimI-like enzyme
MGKGLEAAIRSGAFADVGQVLGIWRDAGALPSPTDNANALEGLLRRDPESLLVAQVDGQLVGALIVGWDGWRGSFYRLAVHPDWRRRGIATALVRAGEDRLSRLGATRLTAIVASDEEGAGSFWAALGYAPQSERTRFVRMIDAGL